MRNPGTIRSPWRPRGHVDDLKTCPNVPPPRPRNVPTPASGTVLLNNCVCTLYRAGPRPHIPFPPNLILYVNLVAKGAPKFFKTLAPRLTELDILYFADAYSRTVRPIDLHNF